MLLQTLSGTKRVIKEPVISLLVEESLLVHLSGFLSLFPDISLILLYQEFLFASHVHVIVEEGLGDVSPESPGLPHSLLADGETLLFDDRNRVNIHELFSLLPLHLDEHYVIPLPGQLAERFSLAYVTDSPRY